MDLPYSLSMTCRRTDAVLSIAGTHVYLPASDFCVREMLSVLIVVPSAMCSGGVE